MNKINYLSLLSLGLVCSQGCNVSRVSHLPQEQLSVEVPFSHPAQAGLQKLGITPEEIRAGYILDRSEKGASNLERYASAICDRLPRDLRRDPLRSLDLLEGMRAEPSLAVLSVATVDGQSVKRVRVPYVFSRIAQQIRVRSVDTWTESTVDDACKELELFSGRFEQAHAPDSGTPVPSQAWMEALSQQTSGQVIARARDTKAPPISLVRVASAPASSSLRAALALPTPPVVPPMVIPAADPSALRQLISTNSRFMADRAGFFSKFKVASTGDAPPPPATQGKVISIAAGKHHTCVVVEVPDSTGGVSHRTKCWGLMDGEFGDSMPAATSSYTVERSARTVNKVGIGSGRSVAVGRVAYTQDSATCVSDENRSVICWGRQIERLPITGHLAGITVLSQATVPFVTSYLTSPFRGSVFNATIPVSSAMQGGQGVGPVVTNGTMTCGVHKLWTSGGPSEYRAMCWGDPLFGFVGLQNAGAAYSALIPGVRDPGDITAPFLMPGVDNGGASSGSELKVAAGGGVSCFLRLGGELWCMGSNGYGQIADPQWVWRQDNSAYQIGGSWTRSSDSVSPSSIPALAGATDIDVDAYGANCAIVSGRVRCWGRASWGLAGQVSASGSVVTRDVPWSCTGSPQRCTETYVPASTPSQIPGLTNAKSVHLGHGAFACAIELGGETKCWGGTKRADYFDPPAAGCNGRHCPQKLTAIQDPIEQLAIGTTHACAVVKNGSEVWCFGEKSLGEMGDGSDPSQGRLESGFVYSIGAVKVSGLFDP